MTSGDLNFLNYFKDQFQKLKNDKSYKYVEHLPELQKVREYIITASLIFQHSFSSQKRDNMKYIVNKSKLLRIKFLNSKYLFPLGSLSKI